MKALHRCSKRNSAIKQLGASFLITGVFLVGAILSPQPASAATELTIMSPQLNDTEIQRHELKTQAERKQEKIESILPKVEEIKKEQEAVISAKAELQAATSQLEKEIAELKIKVAEKNQKAREAADAEQARRAEQSELARKAIDRANNRTATQRRRDIVRPERVQASAPVRRYAPATNSRGNTYTPGQCTWHVKNLKPELPNGLGNADQWYWRARNMGLATGTRPAVGAAATRKVGMHVVYVKAVNGDGTITVSEMNYNWTPYATRTSVKNASDFYYIY